MLHGIMDRELTIPSPLRLPDDHNCCSPRNPSPQPRHFLSNSSLVYPFLAPTSQVALDSHLNAQSCGQTSRYHIFGGVRSRCSFVRIDFETDVRIGFEVFHAYIIRHTASQSTTNGYHSGRVSANKNGRLFFAPFRRNSIFNICIGNYVAQSIPTTIMEGR